jgi:membrane protein YqaA with SNARE-associated domain
MYALWAIATLLSFVCLVGSITGWWLAAHRDDWKRVPSQPERGVFLNPPPQ